VKSALTKLNKCVGQLAGLADACDGPAVMAISMVPNVGSVVGFVCAQAASMVAKFRSVEDRVNSGLAVVAKLAKASDTPTILSIKEQRHVRLTQLALSIKKIGNAVKETTKTVAKVASKAGAAVVSAAKVVGKAVSSLANPIDIVLEKVVSAVPYAPLSFSL
jgi:hypothetical protein